MKNFLILIILICCCLVGINIKKYFIKRKSFYENLLNFCENILNEINFNNQKLILIIENNLNKYDNDFNNFLVLYKNLLLDKLSKIRFENKIKNIFNYLKPNETTLFFNFLYSVGTQTKDEEVEKFNNFFRSLNSKVKFENENFKKYSNLYLKLLIALGLIFVIVFI